MAVDAEQLVDAVKLGASIIGTMIAGVIGYPMLKNKLYQDKQNGVGIAAETRQMESTDERMERLETKINVMDEKLSAHAIKMTRLQMLVIKLEGLMSANGYTIPESIKSEMEELLKEVR